jgi:hypothetical protein
MTSVKMAKMNREKRWPKQEPWFRDPLVCRRCGKLMRDSEPMSPSASYYHAKRPDVVCVNDGETFGLVPETQLPEEPKETQLFMRKGTRRASKRARIAARRARKKRKKKGQ